MVKYITVIICAAIYSRNSHRYSVFFLRILTKPNMTKCTIRSNKNTVFIIRAYTIHFLENERNSDFVIIKSSQMNWVMDMMLKEMTAIL